MVYPSFISDSSRAIQVSNVWPNITGIRKIVIFGDSYSSVGYRGKDGAKAPCALKPLGLDFPGYPLEMWNEEGTPNWVGHLITKYTPEPRYKPDVDEQDEGYIDNPILVYDYAVGGSTIDGVKVQVGSFFLGQGGVGTKPDWAPWTSEETLFVTWVGINDCSWSMHHDEAMSKLFGLQEQLYNAGARNFLFIDVPPMSRSPAITKDREEAGKTYHNWNIGLRSGVVPFAQSHPDASVLLFSAFATFNNILDKYANYGFTQGDLGKPFGKIWCDHLHPTSKIHDIVAFDLYNFLSNIPRKS
ncbi:hypothetical protein J3R30DRAFT_3432052 [Lentinula aciculospora]|uniref:Carbohydrate esterase family 16 protein n=1 Tax=Lentinula aciculospora TaxID=153920 RepID=A0A9W9ASS1_9AGAR|nr:hypothetical protein J3R30DRAFT_3432052 [Lentinula aciculospora]